MRPSTESSEERAFDYARTVALSDGVFAIAMTLLVLTIAVPLIQAGHHGDLGRRLTNQGGQFGSYGLSFVVIAFLWVRHHRFFAEIQRIDGLVTALNLAYLGLVAFLPYPTQVLGRYGDDPISVTLYAGTAGIIVLLAGLMRWHALRAGLATEEGRRRLEQRENAAIAPVVFLLSIPIAFASTTAATLSWALIAVLAGAQHSRRRRHPDRAASA